MSRNLSASCLSELIANTAICLLWCDPTFTKCDEISNQIFFHTARTLSILFVVTITNWFKENVRGFYASASSYSEFLHKLVMKWMIASWSKNSLLLKMRLMSSIMFVSPIIWLFAARICSRVSFFVSRLLPFFS